MASTNNEVDAFLRAFSPIPTAKAPEAIKDKFRHWIDVVNHPENYTQDKGPAAVAARYKSARQSLKRLAEKHPDVVKELMREHENQAGVVQ